MPPPSSILNAQLPEDEVPPAAILRPNPLDVLITLADRPPDLFMLVPPLLCILTPTSVSLSAVLPIKILPLANTDNLPFAIQKKFLIGSNCMIDNFETADLVAKYIKDNNIKDHIILCSAASLSNFIIYKCFKENQDNTFLDIGSCLNPLLNLEGWKYTRGYLTSYWFNSGSHFGRQIDTWS